MSRPAENEYAEYYAGYIGRVPDGDIVEILESQIADFRSLLDGIAEADACVLHEPYTWTIKQAVGHMIDTERVFSYRGLRWASGDSTPIPGFEQNEWVDATDWGSPTLAQLVDELEHCRRANVCMFRRLKPEAWDGGGPADGKKMTTRAVAYCLAGHIIHHTEIIKKRANAG